MGRLRSACLRRTAWALAAGWAALAAVPAGAQQGQPRPVYVRTVQPQEVDPWRDEMMQSYAISAALGVALIGLSIAGTAFIRLRATTDPRKLAESDPWLRARMRQLGKTRADLDDPPPDDPGAMRPARD